MVERRTAPLTPEEEAALVKYREATMKRGLQTGPVDRPEAEQIVKDVYTAAELDPPKMTFWADSPMGGVYHAGVLVSFFDSYDMDKILEDFKKENPTLDTSSLTHQDIADVLQPTVTEFVSKFKEKV